MGHILKWYLFPLVLTIVVWFLMLYFLCLSKPLYCWGAEGRGGKVTLPVSLSSAATDVVATEIILFLFVLSSETIEKLFWKLTKGSKCLSSMYRKGPCHPVSSSLILKAAARIISPACWQSPLTVTWFILFVWSFEVRSSLSFNQEKPIDFLDFTFRHWVIQDVGSKTWCRTHKSWKIKM